MNYSWILDNQINLKQPSHSIEDQNVARFEEFKTLANFEFFSLHSPSPTNYETRFGKIKLCKNGESTTTSNSNWLTQSPEDSAHLTMILHCIYIRTYMLWHGSSARLGLL